MNILGPATVLDALAAWGQRETLSGIPDVVARGGVGNLRLDEPWRAAKCLEAVLEHVPKLMPGSGLATRSWANRMERLEGDGQ